MNETMMRGEDKQKQIIYVSEWLRINISLFHSLPQAILQISARGGVDFDLNLNMNKMANNPSHRHSRE